MGNYAKYYKCALQVNPSSYANYRGEECTGEKEYNSLILEKCKSNGIDIVGLANHGDIDSSKSLRTTLTDAGVVVFPGFEISSAEKIHLVCLFPEDKSESDLNKYLGALDVDDTKKCTDPSRLSCEDIANIVHKKGGFVYAAHITNEGGILKIGKMNNAWRAEHLNAAQIPGKRDEVDQKYKAIIDNTNPDYKRNKPMPLINARDINKPEDLDNPSSLTLVKMTEPSFENFKMAFHDPDSRIRLNSEVEDSYQSSIDSIQVYGGYLDGLKVDLSAHLDAIIGGRGTGKSTILNLIRYTLGKEPDEKGRKKEFDKMMDHNLGDGGRVEMWITSYAQHGKKYHLTKRYKQDVVIEDEVGKALQLSIRDILPSIEIYGQNEIVEAADNNDIIYDMISKMLDNTVELQTAIGDAFTKLHKNTVALKGLLAGKDKDESEVANLPALEEKMHFYEKAGLEKKIPKLTEITNEEAAFDEFNSYMDGIEEIKWPEIPFDSEDNDVSKQLTKVSKDFNSKVENLKKKYEDIVAIVKDSVEKQKQVWGKQKESYDEEIRKSLSELDGVQDKTGSEIATEFTTLLKAIKKAQPTKTRIEEHDKRIKELQKERRTLLETCRKKLGAYRDDVTATIKQLNKKKFKGTIRVSMNYGGDRTSLKELLSSIHGLGTSSLSWIDSQSNLDIMQFAEDVRSGKNTLAEKYSMTLTTADKLVRFFSEEKLLEMEEMRFGDMVDIELFVNGQYKKLDRLSKGQQCTAILHVLLLDNRDPLIIDQPEDNLDNAFISDSLIASLRENKIKRQYIFATHNANIPVFGDAELIIAMEEIDNHGQIADGGIGSIDNTNVKEKVISILEGGKEAFRMRREKYNI